jgi:hypothetical protein
VGGAPGGFLSQLFGGRLGKRAKQIAAAAMDAADEVVDQATDAAVAATGKKEEPEEEEGGEIEMDDLVSQITIEAYITCRCRPLIGWLEKRALVMANRNIRLDFLVVCANTTGAIFAVLKAPDSGPQFSDFIAITVAVASLCMALGDYFYIPAQLGATNSALEKVHNMLVWWDSLSLVQRKTRSTKKQANAIIETAILEVVSARTAVAFTLPGEKDEEEGG